MSNKNAHTFPRDEELPELGDDSEDVSFDEDLPHLNVTPSHIHQRQPKMFSERYGKDWPPPPGMIVADKYRVDRLLGAGGMGVIVVAKHEELGQEVAIKFLNPDAMSDPDVITRFKREARALATIQSDHVVRVLDIGALPSGEPFMVMEYLEGTDLARMVKVRGPLGIEETVGYILQACEPLAEAHAAGIVHRDLKPSNLFLARKADGTRIVKVIDFGISKMVSGAALEGELSMTKTQAILGSPLYIAPEQLKSARTVDARADIWAIGVIMYKLLTGHPPFMGDTMAQLCAMVLLEPAPPLTAKRPDAPPGLAQVIQKCLEKDPGARFQSIPELATALLPFAPPGSEMVIPRLQYILSQNGEVPTVPPADPSASGHRLEVGPGLASIGTMEQSSPSQSYPQLPVAALPPRQGMSTLSVALICGIVAAVVSVLVVFAIRGFAKPVPPAPPPEPVVTVPIISTPPPATAATTSASAAAAADSASATTAASADPAGSAKPKPSATASATARPALQGGGTWRPSKDPEHHEFGDRK
jgi:serine/threonine-protein kinase